VKPPTFSLEEAPEDKPRRHKGREGTRESGEDSSAKASASFLKKRSKKLLIPLAAAYRDTASPD
jgi:hypothetical protein